MPQGFGPRSIAVSSFLFVSLAGFVAGCGADPEEAALVEREAARAVALEKSLAELAGQDTAEIRGFLKNWEAEIREAGEWGRFEAEFATIAASTDQLDSIHRSASEGNAAAIADPAISGMLALDPILAAREPELRELRGRLVRLLLDGDAAPAELQQGEREVTLLRVVHGLALQNFEAFSSPVATIAQYAPPETRRRTFDQLAEALPRLTYGRSRAEAAMRHARDQEEDAATRSRLEATMGTLNVALEEPTPAETTTAAPASAIE